MPAAGASTLRRSLLLGILTLLGCILLVWNAARLRADQPLWQMEWKVTDKGERYSLATWRYWDDSTLAISRYLDWMEGGHRSEGEVTDLPELTNTYELLLMQKTRHEKIETYEFWKTLRPTPFLKHRTPYAVPTLEDPGRALLSALGYRLFGGIAPYLPMWLCILFAVPILIWMVWEFAGAGLPYEGLIVLFITALSPFFLESCTLPHSAVGFYLVALVLLASLSVYAVLGRCHSPAKFAGRMLAGAVLFAVCALCRSGTVLLFPGFLVAFFLAVARLSEVRGPGNTPSVLRPGRRAAIALGLAVVFLLPYLAIRPRERHNVWTSVWQGLGDFGAARGYSWHDRDAKRFLNKAGMEEYRRPQEISSEHEEFFRNQVLNDVRQDPLWYCGVLLKRFAATVSLSKLGPWGPRDGQSLEEPWLHYKFTTPVDWVGFGPARFELPVSVIWLPTIGLAAAWAVARWRGAGNTRPTRLARFGLVILPVAVAALPLPVFISTASGIETQALALVYLLGFVFAVGELVRWSATARFGGNPSARLP